MVRIRPGPPFFSGSPGFEAPKIRIVWEVWCAEENFLVWELLDLLWEGVLAASDSDGQLVVVVATRL